MVDTVEEEMKGQANAVIRKPAKIKKSAMLTEWRLEREQETY